MIIRLAPVVRISRANIEADQGAELEHYTIPLDLPRLYKWIAGNQADADDVAVLEHSGGTIGRHHLVRCPDKGADLTDADATIQVGGNFWRVLPAATLTANHMLTLGTTNAADGDVIEVTRLDSTAFTYAIVNGGPGAGTLCTFPISVRTWGRFCFDGTNWSLRAGGQLPA